MDGGRIGRTGSGLILKTRRDRPRAEDEGDDRLAISRAGHARRVRSWNSVWLAARTLRDVKSQLHTADRPFGDVPGSEVR